VPIAALVEGDPPVDVQVEAVEQRLEVRQRGVVQVGRVVPLERQVAGDRHVPTQ